MLNGSDPFQNGSKHDFSRLLFMIKDIHVNNLPALSKRVIFLIELLYIVHCYILFILFIFYTLSGRTGIALVWHSEGRTIEALSVQ